MVNLVLAISNSILIQYASSLYVTVEIELFDRQLFITQYV